jgi:hypothetical protein
VVGYRPHPYLRDAWRYVDLDPAPAPQRHHDVPPPPFGCTPGAAACYPAGSRWRCGPPQASAQATKVLRYAFPVAETSFDPA